MTPEEKVKFVEEWQSNDYVHPMTCGNNSNHALLVGRVANGKAEMYCPDCDYVQKWIPMVDA